MSVTVSERLRERHGLSVLGVAFHIGFFLVVLASALTLMEHRPVVVNVHAEKVLNLTEDEVSILLAGLQLQDCPDNEAEEPIGEVLTEEDPTTWYKVTFQWFRSDVPIMGGVPAPEKNEAIGTGRWFFDADDLIDKTPTHVRMTSQVICPGEAPKSRTMGPIPIRK